MNSFLSVYLPLFMQLAANTVIIRHYTSLNKYSVNFPNMFGHFIRFFITTFYSKTEIRNNSMRKKIILLAIIYELQMQFTILSVSNISPIIYAIFQHIKTPITCALSIMYLGQRFSFLQYTGLVIISLTTIAAIYENNTQTNTIKYCTMFLLAQICSAVGNVFFNAKLKNSIPDFFSYLHYYSKISFWISIISTSFEIGIKKINIDSHFYFPLFYIFVINCTTMTLVFSHLSMKIDPQKRFLVITFFGSMIGILYDSKEYFMKNIVSLIKTRSIDKNIKFETRTSRLIALLIMLIGVIIYEHKNIANMLKGKRKE